MEFIQFASGRALKQGYGFEYASAGLDRRLISICRSRDLSKMPKGTAVYELHPVDNGQTAVMMTYVSAFGGGNMKFCYTHTLIGKTDAPQAFFPLLKQETFLNEDGFLDLEGQRDQGQAFPTVQLALSADSAPMKLNVPEACAPDVMAALIGYIWQQCEQRKSNPKISAPATIVLPAEFTLQQCTEFITNAILPALPASMRSQFSVVFGCDRTYSGQFPGNTVCYVIQQPNETYLPVFSPFAGTQKVGANNKYADQYTAALGRMLMGEAQSPLHCTAAGKLPESSLEGYRIVRELLEMTNSLIATSQPSGFAPKTLLEQWKQYELLASLLPGDCDKYQALLPLQSEMLAQAKANLNQYNNATLAQLAVHPGWNDAERANLLQAVLEHVRHEENALYDLLGQVNNSSCEYVRQTLHNALENVLIANIANEATEQRFGRLCELLTTKPNARGFSAWILCASRITLTKQLAGKVVQMTPSLLAMKDNSLLEQLMQLFEYQPHAHEMWQIMEMLNFTYEARWQQWDKAERSIISAKFVGDMDQIYESISAEEISGNIQKLQQLNTHWQAQCKRFNRDWHAFATEIAASRSAVQNAVLRTLSACTDTTRYRELANVLGNDWYGDTARIAAGEALVKRLDNIFELPEQTKANQTQIDDRLEKLKLLPDLLKHFGQQELYQNDTRVQLLVTAIYMADKKWDAETMMGTANKMHQAYQANQTVSVSLFVKKCVEGMPEPNLYKAQLKDQPLQPEESGILMVWNLIKHLDKPSSGWASFFNLMGWKPGKNDSPWDDDSIWLLNMLKYVALRLKQLNAAPVWYDQLQEFLLHAEGWDNYIQHMQNDKAYARFMQIPNAKAPQLADILHTPAPIVGRHQRRN